MKEDILDILKVKEREMEALINEARKKGSLMKEDAVKRAGEIKRARMKEIEEELKLFEAGEQERLRKEVYAIETDAETRSRELKKKAGTRIEEASRRVAEFISEGTLD